MSEDLDSQVEMSGSRLTFQATPALGSSKNKMLHVVYRVGDMDRAIKFYQDVFGMEVCHRCAITIKLGVRTECGHFIFLLGMICICCTGDERGVC